MADQAMRQHMADPMKTPDRPWTVFCGGFIWNLDEFLVTSQKLRATGHAAFNYDADVHIFNCTISEWMMGYSNGQPRP